MTPGAGATQASAGPGGKRSELSHDEQRKRARAKAKRHTKHPETHGKHKHGKHLKHHKRKHRRKKPHKPHISGMPGAPLAPAIPVSPPAPSQAPVPSLGSPPIGLAQARRLLWRAGFGPGRAGASDPEALVGQPLEQVVFSLTRPSGAAVLNGPEPVNENGEPLDPIDTWGDDHCWWLDRMLRSDQQLVERMTFIFHDWFANSNEKVNSQRMMLEQNELFRSMCLGSFHDLFLSVTANPAMLIFLDGIYNSFNPDSETDEVNENYAREMMELFSLGADRGAYTQDDVHEMARTLTGFTAEWTEEGYANFRFDPIVTTTD